ncbi:MAG TPA: hypothetical protein VFQ44_31325 [Streptosporangiaceae bacterium]|nr:hypothetical protein [Streptosporangiaceae bacterium]
MDTGQGLVPEGTDNCWTSAPFIYLILSCLGSGLSSESAVRRYVSAYPEFHADIRALSTAVSTAGARVRDEGRLRSDLDDNLKVYTPDEIWLFDLAVDLIAMLGSVDGLSNQRLAEFKNNVRTLDDEVQSHTWKRGVKKAGTGPARFQELRHRVPQHRPNPMRY